MRSVRLGSWFAVCAALLALSACAAFMGGRARAAESEPGAVLNRWETASLLLLATAAWLGALRASPGRGAGR